MFPVVAGELEKVYDGYRKSCLRVLSGNPIQPGSPRPASSLITRLGAPHSGAVALKALTLLPARHRSGRALLLLRVCCCS